MKTFAGFSLQQKVFFLALMAASIFPGTLRAQNVYPTPYTFSFFELDYATFFGSMAPINYAGQSPTALAVDANDYVYVGDSTGISSVDASGDVTLISSDPAIVSPIGMALDSALNIYVIGNGGQTIYEVSGGNVSTFQDFSGTGDNLSSIVVDSSGNVYVLDSANDIIRKITPQKVVSVFVSNLGAHSLAIDKNNTIYVTTNTQVRMVAPNKTVTTLAGKSGTTGSKDATGTAALFNDPTQLGVDTNLNVYVNDTGNDTIREITSAGVVTTLAGSPGTPATDPSLGSGSGVLLGGNPAVDQILAVRHGGRVYLVDSTNDVVLEGGIPATVSVNNSDAQYLGPQSVVATTTPANLTVVFNYQNEFSGSVFVNGEFQNYEGPVAVGTGNYTVTGIIDDANYVGANNDGTLEIESINQTISPITYSGPLVIGQSVQLMATASSGFPVDFSFDNEDSVFEVDDAGDNPIATLTGTNHATLTIFEAGSFTLFANQPGDPNYNPVTGPGQSNDVTNGVAVTLSNLNFTYNGTARVVTGTAFETDGVTPLEVDVTYTVNGASTTTAPTAAGNYPVTGTVNDPTDTYSGTMSGTLVIARAPLTVTATNGSKVYGQTATLSGTAFNSSGLQHSETIGSVTLNSVGTVAMAGVSASPYMIVPSAATGGTFAAANYSITYTNGLLTVSAAPLTIKANNTSKVYGQTFPSSGTGFTPTGLQNSETIGSVTLASAGSVNTAGVAGSPYTLTASAATGGTFTAANYSITYTTGQLTVNAAPLTITAKNASKVFGQTLTFSGSEFTSSGLQNSETIGSVTLNSAGAVSTASVAGSPYAIVPSNATGGTFNPANYSLAYVNGQLTVTAAIPMQIFSDWESQYFSPMQMGIPSDSGLTAIFEKDGIPNLLKYVYNIDPAVPMTTADRDALPSVGMTTSGGTTYMTLTYRQYSELTGVTVTLETSSDLKTWTPVSPPDFSEQMGTDPVTHDPIMMIGVRATGNRQFVHLHVTDP